MIRLLLAVLLFVYPCSVQAGETIHQTVFCLEWNGHLIGREESSEVVTGDCMETGIFSFINYKRGSIIHSEKKLTHLREKLDGQPLSFSFEKKQAAGTQNNISPGEQSPGDAIELLEGHIEKGSLNLVVRKGEQVESEHIPVGENFFFDHSQTGCLRSRLESFKCKADKYPY